MLDKFVPNMLMLVFYVLCSALLLAVLLWRLWRRFVPVIVYYRKAGGPCLRCGEIKQYRIKIYLLVSLEGRERDQFLRKTKLLHCSCEER